MTIKELTTRQVRDRLASVVDDARNGEPTFVTQRGRRVAAIVPADLLDEYERLADGLDGGRDRRDARAGYVTSIDASLIRRAGA